MPHSLFHDMIVEEMIGAIRLNWSSERLHTACLICIKPIESMSYSHHSGGSVEKLCATAAMRQKIHNRRLMDFIQLSAATPLQP